jgi:tetratricopeptide (TPR) repeat protein
LQAVDDIATRSLSREKVAETFRLEVCDYAGPSRWLWRLIAPGGELVAAHRVDLDVGCWQYVAIGDLHGYLRLHAAPDRRLADEARIVHLAGRWIGEHMFGEVGRALTERAPVTVNVVIPEAARIVAYYPLQAAVVGNQVLAGWRVGLALTVGSPRMRVKEPVGDQLRILALFSVPDGMSALNLRKERYGIEQLADKLGTDYGRAVTLRTLQYRATRQRLRETVGEADGWDIVYLSGHGMPGALLLEKPDGSPDLVDARDLVRILEPLARRVKLVTVSTCSSAALTAAEQLHLLGFGPPATAGTGPTGPGRGDTGATSAVGTLLADRLDCAVLAMRYPVTGEFAHIMAASVYEKVISEGQGIPDAVAVTLEPLAARPPTPGLPPLSVATPVVIGLRATHARINAPPLRGDPPAAETVGFPRQPHRFIGRVAMMARAGAVLAPHSGTPAVLLHGMAGAGKTACALELAYTHRDDFEALAWFKAPDEDQPITGALERFAALLEDKFPGLRLHHLLQSTDTLAEFLPELSARAARSRVLVVIDNAESLLTESGRWQDPRWGLLMGALTRHAGLTRLVITSRHLVAGLDQRIRTQAVHALSRDEAVLLARDLPGLRVLMDGHAEGITPHAGRMLAGRVLTVAQGHPKLLELANGHAADPPALSMLVDSADQAWARAGGIPDGFFTSGEPTARDTDYIRVLREWTRLTVAGLPQEARTFFTFACSVEEADRSTGVITSNWADIWPRLGLSGDPPDGARLMALLEARALVAIEPHPSGQLAWCQIHPVVAATTREHADPAIQSAADEVMADGWIQNIRIGLNGYRNLPQIITLVIRAGQAALPYLLRRRDWKTAIDALQLVLVNERSRGTADWLLPTVRALVQATTGTDQHFKARFLLARTLARADPVAGETLLRELLKSAITEQRHDLADVLSYDLMLLYRDHGRLAEALRLADRAIEDFPRAGLGPEAEITVQALRLQILTDQGACEQVLAEIGELQTRAAALSQGGANPGMLRSYGVYESLLSTQRMAAMGTGRWHDALQANEALVASQQNRGAPEAHLARARLDAYAPLLHLGRTREAMTLLRDCREIFEREHDIEMLARVLTALADAEDELGHGTVALDLERDALRVHYLSDDPERVAASHHNYGIYLLHHAANPAAAAAHHLAAAIIRTLTGGALLSTSIQELAADLAALPDPAAAPADLDTLHRVVSQTDGVHLDQILGALTPDPAAHRQAMAAALARVRTFSPAPGLGPSQLAPYLAMWDPVLAALQAADADDAEAAALLDMALTEFSSTDQWSALATALRHLFTRPHQPETPAPSGLDMIDTAIWNRAHSIARGDLSLPDQL